MSQTDKKPTSTIPLRKDVAPGDRWDLSALFADEAAWNRGFEELQKALPALEAFKGTLAQGPKQLKAYLDAVTELELLDERLGYWAHLRTSEDGGDSSHQERFSRYMALATRMAEICSFFTPELLSLDTRKVESWIASPDFDDYRITLKKILRYREHTLSQAEERLLAMQAELRQIPTRAFSSLCDVDFDFGTIDTPEGEKPLSQSSFASFLMSPDRELREKAYRQFYATYSAHKNCLASLYEGSIQQDIYLAKVKNYPSARAKALFPDNVPEAVYDNLVAAVREHFPLLHRYYAIRARALKLDKPAHWDVYAPIIGNVKTSYPYEKGVETVIEALSPLGDEYCSVLRKGLSGGWVDRYENKGKRSGAFSAGSFAGEPYILLNYKEDVLRDLFTLAHEAGHSMHSWYSARNNPFPHYQYTIFEAEVASTFNEQLLATWLSGEAQREGNTALEAYIAAKQADDIVATLFRQTMFAEFESTVHRRVEEGKPVSLDTFRRLYRDLLTDYFGPEVTFIEESDLEGLRIPHFYRAFYVYKYATGLAASTALASMVMDGGASETERYLAFLKSGGRRYPIESLAEAGVDMSSPEPVRRALARFSSILDRLEAAV
jgi:oligoendopeptidase F